MYSYQSVSTFASIFVVILIGEICSAKTIQIGPSDRWLEYLTGDELQPGDELIFQSGTYSTSQRISVRLRGAQENPIILRAANGQRVLFRRPDANQNTLNLEGCQYLQLRGFEITGGASGIRIGPMNEIQSNDIVLEDLYIHHIGGVAITCNAEGGRYERMKFQRIHIHDTADHGEGFYLGGNDGSAIFANSIVANNYIHDLRGPNVSQGDGIEVKQGSFGNHIFNNIIHSTNYPAITVYGTDGGAVNVIDHNIIWDAGDHGIQAAADAEILNNLIANVKACGIYSREHQGALPANLKIEHNLVVGSGESALRIIASISGANAGTKRISIVDNQLFAKQGQAAFRCQGEFDLKASGNFGIGGVDSRLTQLGAWKTSPRPMVELPELAENPAWQSIDRSQILKVFASEGL